MNTEDCIQDIVTRANKIWLSDSPEEDKTIAVSIFINDKGNFVQVWLSAWEAKKVILLNIENQLFEHSSLDGALAKLSAWVHAMGDVKQNIKYFSFPVTSPDDLFFYKDGDRIAGQNGFGD